MKKQNPQKVFESLLVSQAKRGDKKAFSLLYKRSQIAFSRYCLRIMKNKADVDDVMQEAWIAIAKGIKNLVNEQQFSPWARRIIYHKSMDFIKNRKRDIILQDYKIEKKEEPDERLEPLILAMRRLNDHHRLILTFFYLEEMPIAEIAYILRLSPGTVKSRLFHARNKLKKIINTPCYEK